jgi:hypothetical protein
MTERHPSGSPDDDYVRPFCTLTALPDVSPAPPDNSELVGALKAHNDTLKAENADLRGQLAEANARADAAIAALGALADRLNALALERSRPWWKRIGGT